PQTYKVDALITPLLPVNTGGALPPGGYGSVTTYAGAESGGFADGNLTTARFHRPTDIAFDAFGTLFVADRMNNAIRKITPNGTVTTLAGTGQSGYQDGPGNTAKFADPYTVTISPQDGNLYVSDNKFGYVRKITPAGLVSTVAGNGTKGAANGPGSTASFGFLWGSAFDSKGNLFLADASNAMIRKMLPDGTVSTFAGTGYSGRINGPAQTATFSGPENVMIDANDNIYVADPANGMIRKITPDGMVSDLAGLGFHAYHDGPIASAGFYVPSGMIFDRYGNMLVADGVRIRKISPAGMVSTVAGGGAAELINGTGDQAGFSRADGLALDEAGYLYVADEFSNVIRKVSLYGYSIDKPLPKGLKFNPETGAITGTPTVMWPETVYTVSSAPRTTVRPLRLVGRL
ncbi:MAG: hypothetical protein EOO39_38250, partial [Cytophagaceae bacterium]